MKSFVRASLVAASLLAAPLAAVAEPIDFPALKEMVEGMGYVPKMLSKEDEQGKFEIAITAGTFNVPVSFEISKSGRYIWCTANLGAADKIDGASARELLEKVAGIQPTHFWITASNKLMIGMAVDNRDITPAHMKFVVDKLGGDVSSTSALWNKPAAATATPGGN